MIRTFVPINAVTASVANTAAAPFSIARAKAVTFRFTRANHSSGQSDFAVDVSSDGSTWTQYLRLRKNVTSSNSQEFTESGTVNLSSNTTEIYSMAPEDLGYKYARVYVTETTDGTHTAEVTITQD